MNQKEKRDVIVTIEGEKTKEGRLKIEKINQLKSKMKDDKINALFAAGLAGFDATVAILGNKFIDNEIIKASVSSIFALCSIINAGRFVFNCVDLIKKNKAVHNLEEEILNPFVIKN